MGRGQAGMRSAISPSFRRPNQSAALSNGIQVAGAIIPAQAGILLILNDLLDARVRGHDRRRCLADC